MAENFAETTRTVDYQLGVEMALMESPGKFYGRARHGNHAGNKKVEMTDRFSDIEGYDVEERNSKTSHVDPDVERRWMTKPKRRAVPVIIDPDDQATTQVGLKSPLTMGVARSLRRYRDDQFLVGFYGNAITGEDGTISVPFKAANVIAADYAETPGTYTGLTYEKILQLIYLATIRFAMEEETEVLNVAITAQETKDLFRIDRYINGDYRSPELKPIESGKPTNWLGINWIPAQINLAKAYPKAASLAVNGSGHRRLPCWFDSGMHVGTWLDFEGHMDVRPDLHHSEQVAGYSCIGATRLHEDKCFIMEVNGTI